MRRDGTIARRTYLIGSAAIAGGVAFGAYMVNRPIPNPLLDDLAEGEAAITPYVKIDANGITLITPRAEMGQGAVALQANLIGLQITGGSSTTPNSFTKLRTAGPVARETLKEAAAQRTGVNRSLLKTK